MARANASTRSEKITLSLGVLNIEIGLFGTTVNDHGIQRKMFVEVPGEEDHEVGYLTVDKVTGDPVTRDQTVKKVATEYGFVYVEPAEEEALFNLEPRTLAIKSVHPLNHWRSGKLVTKRTWEIEAAPKAVGKKKVPNKTGQITLRALLETLEDKDAFAFGELTTRGIPKPVVLLPSGALHEVYYEEELREHRPPVLLTAEDEAKCKAFYPVISQMLDSAWSDDGVEPTDVRTALIQQFADDKAKAGDFERPAEVPVREAEVVDDTDALLAALTASIQKAS